MDSCPTLLQILEVGVLVLDLALAENDVFFGKI